MASLAQAVTRVLSGIRMPGKYRSLIRRRASSLAWDSARDQGRTCAPVLPNSKASAVPMLPAPRMAIRFIERSLFRLRLGPNAG